jgi:hypothetical protein
MILTMPPGFWDYTCVPSCLAFLLRWGLNNFMTGLPLNHDSQVAGIIGHESLHLVNKFLKRIKWGRSQRRAICECDGSVSYARMKTE